MFVESLENTGDFLKVVSPELGLKEWGMENISGRAVASTKVGRSGNPRHQGQSGGLRRRQKGPCSTCFILGKVIEWAVALGRTLGWRPTHACLDLWSLRHSARTQRGTAQ